MHSPACHTRMRARWPNAKGVGLVYCALNGIYTQMQGKIASFGTGLLAGLATAVGYSRVGQQLREKDSDALKIEGDVNSQEQQLFK